jgi:hypothetical protein
LITVINLVAPDLGFPRLHLDLDVGGLVRRYDAFDRRYDDVGGKSVARDWIEFESERQERRQILYLQRIALEEGVNDFRFASLRAHTHRKYRQWRLVSLFLRWIREVDASRRNGERRARNELSCDQYAFCDYPLRAIELIFSVVEEILTGTIPLLAGVRT